MHSRTGWTAADHPTPGTNKGIFKYEFTDAFYEDASAFYYWFNNTNRIYEDATFTTTPGDLATSTTNDSVIATSATLDWKVWYSDADASAMLVTTGKRIIFFWPGYSQIGTIRTGSWTAGVHNPNTHIFPMSEGGAQTYCNSPGGAGNSGTEYKMTPTWASGSGAYYGATADLFFNDFMVAASQANSGQIYNAGPGLLRINNGDTLFHIPASSGTNVWAYTGINATTASDFVTVSDGTNFYIRMNADLSRSSYMINFSTTEPDFS